MKSATPNTSANMSSPLSTFRFGVAKSHDEDFLARTADPRVIAEARNQLSLPEERRGRHITGIIHRVGRGQNLHWSWQHKDSEWSFAQISNEVCDARPSYVEAHLDAWLENPGRFCPWTCYVKLEELAVETSAPDAS